MPSKDIIDIVRYMYSITCSVNKRKKFKEQQRNELRNSKKFVNSHF